MEFLNTIIPSKMRVIYYLFLIIADSTLTYGYYQESYTAIDSNACEILFIGNSYTGYNDLPGIVQNTTFRRHN